MNKIRLLFREQVRQTESLMTGRKLASEAFLANSPKDN